MAQLNFNASQVAPDTGRPDPIPADWYNMMIVASEMKPTSKGDGAYLEVQLKVVDGQFAGRVVYDRMNLQNQNATAVEIAYKRLSAYCHATGVIQLQDSVQLHNLPMKVKVKLIPPKGEYEAGNEVAGVKNINDPSAGNQQATAPGFQQPPAQQGFQQQPAQPGFQQQVQPAMQQPAQQQPGWGQQPAQTFQQQPAQQQVQPVQQQFQQQPAQQTFQQQQPAGPAAAAGGAVPPWLQQPAQ